MNACDDALNKRSTLLGARIRFSPTGASIRKQAIERIIEQYLSLVNTEGLTSQQLQNQLTSEGLRDSDIRQGIDSLKQSKKVLETTKGDLILYTLSEDTRKETLKVINEAEQSINYTIKQLFTKASGGENAYKQAFLQLLCKVFSRLSDIYIQVITSSQEKTNFTDHSFMLTSIKEIESSEHIPDIRAFHYGVNCFFKESTPLFDRIKWNMAQNFYIIKALGIDSSSNILMSDIFKNADLYCDTNVLIAGLNPLIRHHNSFKVLSKVSEANGMHLLATHITIWELKSVINSHAIELRKVLDKIPDDTQPKVRDFLFEAYLVEKANDPNLSIDSFINSFQSPLQTLQDSFGLIEKDDQWFDNATKEQKTKQLSQLLIERYKQVRGRPKYEKAAIHDALLLLWVAKENKNNHKSWIVTLDVSLSGMNSQENLENAKVTTLDAFLQWMSPISSEIDCESELAGFFSDAIRYQLLPRDTFFQLQDFRVFAEMDIETKQLPSEDIEACIREIKHAGPQLDPSKAEDREKIGQIIQRFFTDPGTKYKRTIEELQTQSDNLSKELADEKRLRVDAENRVEGLKTHSQEMSRKIDNGHNALLEANSRIERLEKLMQEQEKSKQHKRLIFTAVWRTVLALGMLIVVEVIIGYLVWHYGEGPNLFQKLTNAWPWLTLGFAIVAFSYPFLMGRDCMHLLKWWKGETY